MGLLPARMDLQRSWILRHGRPALNKPKRHHFVPKFVLKRFCVNGSERVWYSSKIDNKEWREPKQTAINEAFSSLHYNSLNVGDKKITKYETDFYSLLDGVTSELFDFILSKVDAHKELVFSGEIPDQFYQDIWFHYKRSPDFEFNDEGYIKDKHIDEKLEEAIQEVFIDDRLPPHLKQSKLEQHKNEIARDLRLGAQVEPLDNEALSIFKEFSLVVGRASGRHRFIISSRWLLRRSKEGDDGMSNPNTQLWMPISPEVALILVRTPNNKNIPVRLIERDLIRSVNEQAVRESSLVASHSDKLLRSLIS